MIELKPIDLDKGTAVGITVDLPDTHLAIVSTERGYIMCGALDVQLLRDRLADRGIIAGRAVGVKTIEQLLDAPLESITQGAEQIGIEPGMQGREAIKRML